MVKKNEEKSLTLTQKKIKALGEMLERGNIDQEQYAVEVKRAKGIQENYIVKSTETASEKKYRIDKKREAEDEKRNSDIIRFAMEISKIGLSTDKDDVEAMQNQFVAYLQKCQDENIRIGNVGAYLSIGVTVSEARAWKNGQRTPKHRELIERIDMVCGICRETLANENKISAPTAIFQQKNFDSMKDAVEDAKVDLTASNVEMTATEIMEKYGDLTLDEV